MFAGEFCDDVEADGLRADAAALAKATGFVVGLAAAETIKGLLKSDSDGLLK